MPPRDLVSIRSRDLDHLARRYRELNVDFGKSMQGALNEVATSSTKRMKDRFESDIDGGPTKWTAIKPGSTSGSVVTRKGTYDPAASAISSKIEVSPNQSRYLKYLLGVERERRAGDTGAADEWNFIPVADAYPYLDEQGVDPVYGQNLRQKTISRLMKRAAAQQKKLDEYRARGKPVQDTGPLRFGRIFFGRVGRTTGFFERPVGRPKDLKLLILAQKVSRYDRSDGYLVPAWNDSVLAAARTLPFRMERRLNEALAARGGGAGGSGAGGPP
ncbi:hypothetical protein [Aureimonas sp. N4]|uniref:hypothetical protein n=1 Tax=Aureimonas sp. N4 TaxID=1638165 RepID=UPI0007849BF0|nr:hypothetical protein [Aureimonas sp. N4]